MIGAAISDELVIGLVFGIGVGLLAGPLIRSWLVWREWSSASREADGALRQDDLIEELLERIEADAEPSGREARGEADVGPGADGRTLRKSWPR